MRTEGGKKQKVGRCFEFGSRNAEVGKKEEIEKVGKSRRGEGGERGNKRLKKRISNPPPADCKQGIMNIEVVKNWGSTFDSC
jgi:hypothetical protein